MNNERNTYDRNTLYKEVWKQPVTKVAKKYGVSDVALHKICKSLDVPVPPRGYWAKQKNGKTVIRTLLPSNKNVKKTKTCLRRVPEPEIQSNNIEISNCISEKERSKILSTLQEVKNHNSESQLHALILRHKKVVANWNKNNASIEWKNITLSKYIENITCRKGQVYPIMAGVISEGLLDRAYKAMDIIIKTMEVLGYKINNDLSINIRDESVYVEIFEKREKINHIITKQEAKIVEKYELDIKRNKWASKPQIRKYDYIFTGILCISGREHAYFRDSDNSCIEDKLKEVVIDLFIEAELIRIERETREAKLEKEKKEQERKESIRERYNKEVEDTANLENIIQDWEMACKIRELISEMEFKDTNNKKANWIKWAKQKADWYDPTVSRTDEFFGKRIHYLSKGKKTPQERLW